MLYVSTSIEIDVAEQELACVNGVAELRYQHSLRTQVPLRKMCCSVARASSSLPNVAVEWGGINAGRTRSMSSSMFCTPLGSYSASSAARRPSSYLEPEALHACSVLVDGRLTILGRIGGVGKKHAFVSFRLLVFAHAAGLLGNGAVSTVPASWRHRGAPAQTDLGLRCEYLGAARRPRRFGVRRDYRTPSALFLTPKECAAHIFAWPAMPVLRGREIGPW